MRCAGCLARNGESCDAARSCHFTAPMEPAGTTNLSTAVGPCCGGSTSGQAPARPLSSFRTRRGFSSPSSQSPIQAPLPTLVPPHPVPPLPPPLRCDSCVYNPCDFEGLALETANRARPPAATPYGLVSSWGILATRHRTRSCRASGTIPLGASTARWSFSRTYKEMPLLPLGRSARTLTRWLPGQIPQILGDCDFDAS